MAVARFVRPADTGIILILTDHSGIADAAERGYARSWAYNSAVGSLRKFAARFELRHTPGESNPVDFLSRGGTEFSATAIGDATRTLVAASGGVAVGPNTRTFGSPAWAGQLNAA